MNNIILIGMPGVGKSSIGVVLAKVLGMDFIDSDLLIQNREGRTLKEIISDVGQKGFTELEDRINSQISSENAVIATGGSAVYGKRAMEHFRQIGTVVYLSASYEDLSARISDMDARGVVHAEGQTFKELYDERCSLYEKYADITVHENGIRFSIDDAISSIIRETEKYRRGK